MVLGGRGIKRRILGPGKQQKGLQRGFSTWDQPFRGAKSNVGRAVFAPAPLPFAPLPASEASDGSPQGQTLARLFAVPQHPVFPPTVWPG